MSVTVQDILKAVAEEYGLTVAEIQSRSRAGHLIEPRHMVFWLARRLATLSFPAIGTEMSRNHTTVIYGVKVFEDKLKKSPAIRRRTYHVLCLIRSDKTAVKAVKKKHPPAASTATRELLNFRALNRLYAPPVRTASPKPRRRRATPKRSPYERDGRPVNERLEYGFDKDAAKQPWPTNCRFDDHPSAGKPWA